MPYSDFTLKAVESRFGLTSTTSQLFGDARHPQVPDWLTDHLRRSRRVPLLSEKSRGELIVMPVLLACRELTGDRIAIYSGPRLDVDAELGLTGECDFLLGGSPDAPEVRSPLAVVVEAKKNDIEAGLGQCVAQLIGARIFNERDGNPTPILHGCVTTGELWQFLRLDGSSVLIDSRRYFLNEVAAILGIFQGLFPPPPAD